MKNIVYGMLLFSLLGSGCKEKDILIPTIKAGSRRVLVEEITGVNCTNCPKGARELRSIQEQVGEDKLILIAVHSGGNLSEPIPESKYDLQTQKGYQMVAVIGQLSGIPSAAIGRRFFPDQGSEFSIPTWASKISDEFKYDFHFDLFVNNTYDPSSRKLDVKVNMSPDSTLAAGHRLTVVITQDSIIDAQNDNSVIYPNYVHRHVLRDIISRVDGDPIDEPLKAGAQITKNYSVTLDSTWDAKHCTVVAYVHGSGVPDKVVVQAAEAHVE